MLRTGGPKFDLLIDSALFKARQNPKKLFNIHIDHNVHNKYIANMSINHIISFALLSMVFLGSRVKAADRDARLNKASSTFALLVDDEGLKSAIELLKVKSIALRASPTGDALQGLYLASRDLKSQLNRHSLYFGDDVRELGNEVLPILNATRATLSTNPSLGKARVDLALANIDSCQKLLAGSRNR